MMTHGSKKNCVLKPSRPFPTVRVIRVRNRRDRFTLNHPKKVEKTDIVWDRLRPSLKKAPTCCSMKPSRPFQTIPIRTVMIQSETVKTISTNTIFVTLIIHIYIYIYVFFIVFSHCFRGVYCSHESWIMNVNLILCLCLIILFATFHNNHHPVPYYENNMIIIWSLNTSGLFSPWNPHIVSI